MAAKTRYLQLSLTTMLEYNIDVNVEEFQGNKFEFLYTRLKNGHTAILSPCSYEVKFRIYGPNTVTSSSQQYQGQGLLNNSQDGLLRRCLDNLQDSRWKESFL